MGIFFAILFVTTPCYVISLPYHGYRLLFASVERISLIKAPKTRKWWVTAVVVLGMFMAILDNSIVSVTLPQIQNAFHTDFQTVTWIATIYLLVQAAMIPIVGYLSDRLGSRRVFLTALTLFTVGSLLCALAPTKEALIAFRALQAIGTLTPVGSAIIYRAFPPIERSAAVSVITVPILMAPAVGPTIGGYLSTNFNWNAIFIINVPFGIVTLFLAFLILPRRRLDSRKADPSGRGLRTRRARRRFDVPGLLLSMIGFTTLVYGITQAGSMGWDDLTVLTSLLIGAAVLVVFIVVEWRVRDPVIDLRLFTNYTFAIASFLTWVIMATLVGSLFMLPLFFENVQGNTALTTGSFMISQGLTTAVGIAIVGKLYHHVGPRILVVSGLLLLIGGTYGLTQIDTNTTGQSLQIWLLLRGLGTGFAAQPLQVLALSVVSNKGMTKALSLISVTRQIASALGVVALTTYLTQQATTHATGISNILKIGSQTHQLTSAATCIQTVGPTLNQIPVGQTRWLQACLGQHATAMGMADTFWIVLLSYVACTLLALLFWRDPALGFHKQKKAKTPITEALLPVPSISNAISTLITDGKEVIGSEILLRCCPENNMVNSSQLTVESNPLHVVKLPSAVPNVYETDQYAAQTPDNLLSDSMQQASSSEPVLVQHEVLDVIRSRDELMKALRAFGMSELDALHCFMAIQKDAMNYHVEEQKDDKDQKQYMAWRRKLELYADEVAALQAEFDDLCLRMEAHRARLQKLSHAINDDLLVGIP
jgi:EmrB/QacA subfamily drug resistance transporter